MIAATDVLRPSAAVRVAPLSAVRGKKPLGEVADGQINQVKAAFLAGEEREPLAKVLR